MLSLNDKIEECSGCGQWLTAEDLITGPKLHLIGMARRNDDSMRAYYFFTHDVPGCGSSLLIDAEKFIPYISEITTNNRSITCSCSNDFCVHIDELKNCGQKCFLEDYRNFFFLMLKLKADRNPTIPCL
jgi:hypothetical protein